MNLIFVSLRKKAKSEMGKKKGKVSEAKQKQNIFEVACVIGKNLQESGHLGMIIILV